ncbi:MAG: hypothetical protein AB8G99_05310 [Planctomycetaceae bacterium]
MRQTSFPFLHILGDLTASEVNNQFGGCRLCWAVSPQARRFAENTLLLETDDFIVTPALGSLNRENLLFIAKSHVRPLGTWSTERAAAAEEQLEEVIRRLQPIAPEWLAFEHGASRQCRTRSCCIDHFHMHLIPIDQPTAQRLTSTLPTDTRAIDSLAAIPEAIEGLQDSYVSVRLPDGTKQVAIAPSFPSQFIRQQLAAANEIEDEWNWRSHPRELVASRTVSSFRRKEVSPLRIYFAHAIEERQQHDIEEEIANARFRLQDAGISVLLSSMYETLEDVFDEELQLKDADLDETLVQCEIQFLQASDLLIVDLRNPGWQYVGCLMEIVYAREAGVPVIALTGESTIKDRLWLRTHVDATLPTVDEAIDWIRTNEARLRGTEASRLEPTFSSVAE